jgi:hypothetical protein
MAGPPGPSAFVLLVRHAQRLAALLFVYELTPPANDAATRVWLVGRSAEVERYLESLLEDVRSQAIDEASAANSLTEYLEGLHISLVAHFGVTEPPCCKPRPRRRKTGKAP